MTLLAIDPGTEQSGWVRLTRNDSSIVDSGVCPNSHMLGKIRDLGRISGGELAIEMMSAQGMPVGRETFETVRWIGRFQQAFHDPDAVMFVLRREVQLHLCGTTKAKDTNIRQALIDLFGPVGRKAEPGPTYGIKSHAWSALGVAATVRGLT